MAEETKDKSKEEQAATSQDVEVGPKHKYSNDHKLLSTERGESEVEALAKRIEGRRDGRVVITFDVRVALVEGCRQIAVDKGYPILGKIDIADLLEFRNKTKSLLDEQKKTAVYKIKKLLHFRVQSEQLLEVLDRAVPLVQDDQDDHDNWFHYMDFNIYYTKVESKWPWMRNGVTVAFMVLFLFYLVTPILFCNILNDSGVCPSEPGKPYSGWMSALYFASTTLSTVGYGDLSVEKDEVYKVFFGTVYMIFANITLITAFSAAFESGFGASPIVRFQEKLIARAMGKPNHEEALYKKIRRLKILRLTQIVGSFTVLNLVGVFANRLFLLVESEDVREEWNWMISFYWAVQTTTTIGYGDLTQPYNMRWFQIFYLILSTAFVGNTLGGLASLRGDIEEVRRKTAWERRKVSRSLIDEMQPEDNDARIDQYEFLVASLLQLGKISSEDVESVMDKFRELSGDKGFIVASETKNQQEATEDDPNTSMSY